MSIILGIDPGSRITGYGIIAFNGQQYQYLACGAIQVKGESLSERLAYIFARITEVMQEHKPHHAAIESVFMHCNPDAALKLGQARGAAIVAASQFLVDNAVAEYSARQIKQAVVGYGAATKEQVQQMVKALLRLSAIPSKDAADALAVAICHANTQKGLTVMGLNKASKRGWR